MKPANLLRWYPRAWRERYGEELLVLIQDTLDGGRPTWRLRLGVIWGGLRERGHQAGRAGKAAVKRWVGTGSRPLIVTVGLLVISIPSNLKAPLPPTRAWQATAVFAALAGLVAFAGVCVLASALVAVPAFAAFLREGGWPKIRRRVAWATGATVAAGGSGAWLILGVRSMSFAQLNHTSAYLIDTCVVTLALAVAVGLWASAVAATAKRLKLTARAQAAQVLLGTAALTAAFLIMPVNCVWNAVIQSSLPWLVVGVANLALIGAVMPRGIGRAVRRSRRLRAAASGARLVNPSAQRTHGRHRA
jgi:hypothetical protein